MFCGHIDTVGVAGITRPFDPVERDGRIYGRGSQDMKSGVAAMIGAARVIAESGGLAAGRLVIACVVDEEHASIGADALVTSWRADAAVVTEPTDLQVAVAHKGFEWVEVETEGAPRTAAARATAATPSCAMGRVLGALERSIAQLQARAPHALVGAASLHASLIEGGRELSSYPDRCRCRWSGARFPASRRARPAAKSARDHRSPKADDAGVRGRQPRPLRAVAVRNPPLTRCPAALVARCGRRAQERHHSV